MYWRRMQCASCPLPATGMCRRPSSFEYVYCCSAECGTLALIGDKRGHDDDERRTKRQAQYTSVAEPRDYLQALVRNIDPPENVLSDIGDVLSYYPAALMTARHPDVIWLMPTRTPALFEQVSDDGWLHRRTSPAISADATIVIQLDNELRPTVRGDGVIPAWRRAVEQATRRRFVVVSVLFSYAEDSPDDHAAAILWDRVDGSAIFVEPHASPMQDAAPQLNMRESFAALARFVTGNLPGVSALVHPVGLIGLLGGPQSWFHELRPASGRRFSVDGGWCVTATLMWIEALVRNAPSRRPLRDSVFAITAALQAECSTWVRFGPGNDSWLINYHHYLLEQIYADVGMPYYSSIFANADVVAPPETIRQIEQRAAGRFAAARTAL